MEFLVPKETDSDPQLVVFHLSIPMWYVESTPLFFADTDTIKDTDNNNMHQIRKFPVHPLGILAETPPGDRYQRR